MSIFREDPLHSFPAEPEATAATTSGPRIIGDQHADGVDPGSSTKVLESNQAFELLVQSILLPTLCFLGILGNLLNIFILTRQRIRRGVKTPDQAVNVGLVSLAVSDMVVCLSTLPRAFVPEYRIAFDGESFALYYQIYSTGVITTFGLISTWLIVITAAIRYTSTCCPLRPRLAFGHAGSCVAILMTYCACAVVNLPSFYLFKANQLRENDTEVLIDLGQFSHFTAQGLVFHWIRSLVAIFVPGALLGFFNIRLMQALRQSDVIRRQSQTSASCHAVQYHRPSRRNRLNVTLVAVIVMFVCLVYPCELLDFFAHLLPPQWVSAVVDREVFLVARMILNALQLSNFALNFILYCTFNAQFRRVVADLCCRRPGLRISRIFGCAKTRPRGIKFIKTHQTLIKLKDVEASRNRRPS